MSVNKKLSEGYVNREGGESTSVFSSKEIKKTQERVLSDLQNLVEHPPYSSLEVQHRKLREEYALLLALPEFSGEGFQEVIHLHGVKLYKKNEFHITITGHNFAPLMQAVSEKDPTFMGRLEGMIEDNHFYVKDLDIQDENNSYAFIGDEKIIENQEGQKDSIKRYALIKPVHIPGVEKLYMWLEKELQTKIEPFLHVTLYTNDHKGIGIASYEKFRESFLQRVPEQVFLQGKKEG